MRASDDHSERASLIASAIRLCLRKYFTKEQLSFSDLAPPGDYKKTLKGVLPLPGLVRLYQGATYTLDAGDVAPPFYRDILWSGCNEPAVLAADNICYRTYVSRSRDTLLHFAVESVVAASEKLASQQRVLQARSTVTTALEEAEDFKAAKKVLIDQLRLVLWLLRQGADPFFNNNEGLAPVAYMMENSELFELFYRKWLVGRPVISTQIQEILFKLKAHWQSYDLVLSSRERDPSHAFYERARRRREDLSKIFILMGKVEENLFIVWDLVLEVRALEKAAPRGRKKISLLYDVTMPLIEELGDLLEKEVSSSKSTYSKKTFVLDVSQSLLIKAKEKRALRFSREKSLASLGEEGRQVKAERRLPATENILTESLHRLMISEAMQDEGMRDTRNVDFYIETIWGRLWGRMQAMIGWLHRYDQILTVRESRSQLFKRIFGENGNRLIARRAEWREYKDALNEVFGVEDVFSFVNENASIAAFNVICPRDNPVCESQSSTGADSIARQKVMTRYLKFFSVLVPLIERGLSAERGVSGISDLHDNMYSQWKYVKGAYDSWMEAHLTEKGKLILAFKSAFGDIRCHIRSSEALVDQIREGSSLNPSPLKPLSLVLASRPDRMPKGGRASAKPVAILSIRRPIPLRRDASGDSSGKPGVPQVGLTGHESLSTSLPSRGLFKPVLPQPPRWTPQLSAGHSSDSASSVTVSMTGMSRLS